MPEIKQLRQHSPEPPRFTPPIRKASASRIEQTPVVDGDTCSLCYAQLRCATLPGARDAYTHDLPLLLPLPSISVAVSLFVSLFLSIPLSLYSMIANAAAIHCARCPCCSLQRVRCFPSVLHVLYRVPTNLLTTTSHNQPCLTFPQHHKCIFTRRQHFLRRRLSRAIFQEQASSDTFGQAHVRRPRYVHAPTRDIQRLRLSDRERR